MKTFISLAIILFSCTKVSAQIVECSGMDNVWGEPYIVSQAAGTSLVLTPHEPDYAIAHIPPNARIQICRRDSLAGVLGGQQGYWRNAEWEEKRGYVFDAHIRKETPDEIPELSYLLEYFSDHPSGEMLFIGDHRLVSGGLLYVKGYLILRDTAFTEGVWIDPYLLRYQYRVNDTLVRDELLFSMSFHSQMLRGEGVYIEQIRDFDGDGKDDILLCFGDFFGLAYRGCLLTKYADPDKHFKSFIIESFYN